MNNMNNIDMNLLMGLLSGGNNPEQMVQNLAQKNPNMNAVLQQVKQSGMSMKDFTMQYAKNNGIDIQPLLNMMSQKGIK
jgi:hypothetical protein